MEVERKWVEWLELSCTGSRHLTLWKKPTRKCNGHSDWHGNPKGICSVKSGYAMEINLFAPPPYQSSQPDQKWWLTLWRLSLSPKIRLFLWRACRDLIPSTVNLASRYIPTYAICPLCHCGVANTSHCLIFCSLVKCVCKNFVFWVHLKKLQSAPFLDSVLFIAKVFPGSCWNCLVL